MSVDNVLYFSSTPALAFSIDIVFILSIIVDVHFITRLIEFCAWVYDKAVGSSMLSHERNG